MVKCDLCGQESSYWSVFHEKDKQFCPNCWKNRKKEEIEELKKEEESDLLIEGEKEKEKTKFLNNALKDPAYKELSFFLKKPREKDREMLLLDSLIFISMATLVLSRIFFYKQIGTIFMWIFLLAYLIFSIKIYLVINNTKYYYMLGVFGLVYYLVTFIFSPLFDDYRLFISCLKDIISFGFWVYLACFYFDDYRPFLSGKRQLKDMANIDVIKREFDDNQKQEDSDKKQQEYYKTHKEKINKKQNREFIEFLKVAGLILVIILILIGVQMVISKK